MHHLYWNSHSLIFIHRHLHIKNVTCLMYSDRQRRPPQLSAISRCTSAMPDPPRKFDVTIPKPALEIQHIQRPSASGSSHPCSQPPAVRCALFSASSSSRIEVSRNRSLPRSPRRLPIPPTYASPPASSLSMPSSSSSNLLPSSSTLSLPTLKHPPHSRSVFVF